MTTTIIGIHGLANKPDSDTLTNWWIQSIKEGLKKNQEIDNPDINFEMVYWADLLYKAPQHNDQYFDFDALFNEQPYIEAHPNSLKEYHENWLDFIQQSSINLAGDIFDLAEKSETFSKIPKFFIKKFLKDLSLYYTPSRKILNRQDKPEAASAVLQRELTQAIEKHRDAEKIVLIAHSMGSIIAYDVLRDLGQTDNPPNIDHFITIGSPLGLPYVKKNIELQRKSYSKLGDRVVPLRSPTIVSKSWVNYADKRDPVAFDTQLEDEFEVNDRGIQVVDDLVMNDYEGLNGKANAHKSYGYLRTPEISRQLAKILLNKT